MSIVNPHIMLGIMGKAGVAQEAATGPGVIQSGASEIYFMVRGTADAPMAVDIPLLAGAALNLGRQPNSYPEISYDATGTEMDITVIYGG